MKQRTVSRRFRRRAATALAAAALAVTSACTGTAPGTAATVGDVSISHEQVDEVAAALCAAQTAQGVSAAELPSRGARLGALEILISAELARILAEREGVRVGPQELDAVMEGYEAGIASVPEELQEPLRQALRDNFTGQLALIEVGRESLRAAGESEVSDEAAFAEGERLRTELAASVGVQVDPRYGSYREALRAGGRGLSVATSDTATTAEQAQPPAAYVSSLPPSQTCQG